MNAEKKVEVLVEHLYQDSRLARLLLTGLRKLGINQYIRKQLVYRQYDKDKKNPTDEMRTSVLFFEENRDRVEHITQLLEDDLSKDIYHKVIEYKCTHDRKAAPAYSTKDQYFPKDIIKLQDEEVFIDCGAYVGDTLQDFKKACNNTFKKVVCFEPDQKNFDLLVKNTQSDKRVISIMAGAWHENGFIGFDSTSGMGSKIADGEDMDKIEVRSMDETPECADATFIKMDIEGAEYNALLGAQNIIKKNHPKLAICIYHSDEDMVRLAELIKSFENNYKFYIRHHNFELTETVLYAVYDEKS